MAPLTVLMSCSIIEKDCNGDILWTWTYPAVSESQKCIITRKCNVQTEFSSVQSFVCSRHKDNWFYINCSEVFDTDKLPRIKQFALVLFTKDFNPEKYEVLCRILSKMYCKTGNTTEILKLYLSVYINGTCTTQENGIFLSDDFDGERLKNVDGSYIRGLIKTFELETILIYTALLLKKRIIIYHHSLEQLLKWIKTIPTLMTHRRITDTLFPWVDLVSEEIADLKNNLHYVAGCMDSAISKKVDLYDLLVNIPAREITIAPHAKDSFTMTKTHKEIALFIVQLCDNNLTTEPQIISEIAEKTQELLNQLKTLTTIRDNDNSDKIKFCIKKLRECKLSPAVESFLINLAVAENLIM
ncbi:hypothetical protein PV327_010057 [Microctonus hyperodae]|uniref:UDENN domain-containing protein n=1 Tax=Microctonus hyperodae TaxID=165561 RepID=A0AA39F2A1_MICHY|nr:hypothetical protein PV327_010057 [Microctonus hyperodae]